MLYRWLFIGGLATLAGVAIWLRGIHLGLDLKGGIHLMIRVHTEDALDGELDVAVERLKADFAEKNIEYGELKKESDPANKSYRIIVERVADDDIARARLRSSDLLPDFSREDSGSRIVLSLSATARTIVAGDTVDQAVNTIRGRVNATGVAEPVIQREGLGESDRILVQLPGVQDSEAVKELIGRVANLELKLVDKPAAEQAPFSSREGALGAYSGTLPPDMELVEGLSDAGEIEFYVVERVPVITGRDLARARCDRDPYGLYEVLFTLNTEGSKKFGKGTGDNVGRRLAVVLDDQVKSAPRIQSRITDNGVITGVGNQQECRELALVLREGALPARIEYLEERSVQPSLGRLSIEKGLRTAIIGIILVGVLMLFYYRRAGVNAVAALVLNALLLGGALALLEATLTLPGIAGFILTLGMAVDANVLVFEAIRENLRGGQGVRRAIEEGFARAFTTIIDSNLTTLLAAGALWMLGSGPVRGFGVTLFIGLIINIFTAYYVSKTIFQSTVLNRELKPGETLSI